MRVAGGGELQLGRRKEVFTATEVADADKPEILRAYLRKWRWEVGMFFDGVGPDKELGTSANYGRIEYAYYLMATAAGVEMMPCRLLAENGRAHFMTKRFDRDGNARHHIGRPTPRDQQRMDHTHLQHGIQPCSREGNHPVGLSSGGAVFRGLRSRMGSGLNGLCGHGD